MSYGKVKGKKLDGLAPIQCQMLVICSVKQTLTIETNYIILLDLF